MTILINNNLNITLIKKNKIKFLLVYSKYYYIKYIVSNNFNIYFNKNCNTLVLKNSISGNHNLKLNEVLSIQSFQIIHYFYKKIVFTGKSYKIKKTSNNLSLEFNKSHQEIVSWKNCFLKKLKKTKLILKNVNSENINRDYWALINTRQVNPFTLRGLRGNRFLLKKKIGKKSN